MRIASTQYQVTLNHALQSASAHLSALTQKMASGQRLLLPSDDPLAGVRLARLARQEASIAQYRDNIGAVKARMQTSEGTLSGVSADLQQANDLLVDAADGGHSSDDLAAIAMPLGALRDSILYAANTKDQEGHYLFSGTATATPAIAFDAAAPAGSRYSFKGNTALQQVIVASDVTQPANVAVPELADVLNRLDAAIGALQTPGASANDAAVRGILGSGLDATDSALAAVGVKIATLGSTQNVLAAIDSNHANVSLANQQSLINLGQLDYGEAAVELNNYTLAVQASQKAYARVSGLSLFNAL